MTTDELTDEMIVAMIAMHFRRGQPNTVRALRELQSRRLSDRAVAPGSLHRAAQQVMSLASKIERASTEAEENALCDERDKLFALFRKADAALSTPAPGEDGGTGQDVGASGSAKA